MKKFSLILTIILLAQFDIPVAQWQPDLRLTNAPNNSFTSYNNARSVAVNGNNIHILWYDNRGGTYNQIFYKRSNDGGNNWGADSQLTNNTWYITGYPSIAVSGSNIHLTWIYNHNAYGMLFYKRSTDDGINWTPNSQLTNTNISAYYPSTALSGSVVHIVYSYWQPGRIFYSRSDNNGLSWAAPFQLVSINNTALFPSVSTSGSAVHVVWQDNRDGNEEIYYIRSSDNGMSWGAETRLSNNTGYSAYPTASSSGSLALVAWQDNRDGNYEIYYKRSTNNGLSWGTDTRLTNNSDSSYYPSIYVTGSNVHAAWQDYRNGQWEVYYKRSTDGGSSWTADTRLTNNSAASITPSIAVSNSSVFVVWSDNRDGNYEIYYKKDPTGNLVGIKNISTEIPNEFSLSQNYPNPFNPTTVISFQLAVNSYASLKVHDAIGREVVTLVNEQLQPGTYEVEFDGSNFSSGVYYYKLIAGDFAEIKKMILIK